MRLFFRLPNGLTMENPHDIDPSDTVNYLKEYAYDLLCTRYDMSKITFYIMLKNNLLTENKQIRDLNCKSYDTILIGTSRKFCD